jgi:hypothetical protein
MCVSLRTYQCCDDGDIYKPTVVHPMLALLHQSVCTAARWLFFGSYDAHAQLAMPHAAIFRRGLWIRDFTNIHTSRDHQGNLCNVVLCVFLAAAPSSYTIFSAIFSRMLLLVHAVLMMIISETSGPGGSRMQTLGDGSEKGFSQGFCSACNHGAMWGIRACRSMMAFVILKDICCSLSQLLLSRNIFFSDAASRILQT